MKNIKVHTTKRFILFIQKHRNVYKDADGMRDHEEFIKLIKLLLKPDLQTLFAKTKVCPNKYLDHKVFSEVPQNTVYE